MEDKYSPDDMKNLWQNQRVEHVPISLDDIYRKAQELQKEITRRTLIGIGCVVAEIVAFGLFVLMFPNVLQRIGSGLTIAGMLYWMYQIYNKRTGDMPFGRGHETCINFLRRDLQRQREFHEGLSFWLRVVTILPGPVLFAVGFAIADPSVAGYIRAYILCFVALIILAIPLNLRKARKYQRQIDELDSLEKQS